MTHSVVPIRLLEDLAIAYQSSRDDSGNYVVEDPDRNIVWFSYNGNEYIGFELSDITLWSAGSFLTLTSTEVRKIGHELGDYSRMSALQQVGREIRPLPFIAEEVEKQRPPSLVGPHVSGAIGDTVLGAHHPCQEPPTETNT